MIRILQGDCRDVLPTLAANSVQCVVTSPPYFGLRDYNVAGQIGLEASTDAFVAELVAVFREVRRVLRDDGTLWLNLGDSYNANQGAGFDSNRDGGARKAAAASPKVFTGLAPKQLLMMPARVALALQADGWWLRSDIIWAKPNPMPESVTDRPTSAHEHVFLLTKRAEYFFDADAVREPASENTHPGYSSNGIKTLANAAEPGVKPSAFDGYRPANRNIRNVWSIATAPYADAHFATFPPALAERCIRAGTSERGCCPACGAPWERIVDRTPTTEGRDTWAGQAASKDGRSRNGGFYDATATTTGWRQDCACPAADPVPCVVLDVFAGAFTAPLVADRLQRDAIGIELSAAYCAMARARLIEDAGMFAELQDAAN